MLKVISSAMGGNLSISEFLRPICLELGLDFKTMSEWPDHDIKWTRETWLDELKKADIVVCVARHDLQPGKSANRAVQAMALGKPVLCSPLPAYEEIIQSGVNGFRNGFICRSEEDWKEALSSLRDDSLRASIGQAAKASVKDSFSLDVVGAQWSDLIKRRAFRNCRPPKVDIIIATYGNLEYLKLCIESIRLATDWPHNIIIVASGNKDGSFEWIKQQPDVIHHCSETRLHFSAANNVGLNIAKEKYVCLLNDDTLVGKGWLTALMHEAQKLGVGAVGPFSNCDQGWRHQENIVVGGRVLKPGMKMEDVAGIEPQIRDYWHKTEVHARKWVAFYCTLMPREAVDKVGLLDEGYLSGDEDLDYCWRLRKAGYRIVQTFGSWVFHYGGKTRKKAEDQDHALHHEEDAKNHDYFTKKWGMSPGSPEFRDDPLPEPPPVPAASAPSDLKVATRTPITDFRPLFGIYTGQGWERWSPRSIDEGGIGGSETATIFTAREFARRGFRSVVFGDCDGMEGVYDGVEYIHYPKWDEFRKANRFHFFVSSRRADIFEHPIMADKKAIIVHDIWLSQDPNANLWVQNVDKFFVLSPWHKEFFLKHHKNADPTKTVISRDGIDLARFSHRLTKEPGRMVYSSSPDRGLDVLLDCLPEIRKCVPHANVHVFYGFENLEKAIKHRGGRPGELEWMNAIKVRLDDPGVVYRGRVGQTQLAKEMCKAEIWAYPTAFTETFCMTGAEEMAAGNPVITSDLAALSTTVGDAGILIPGWNGSPEYKARFIDEVVTMLTDKDRWRHYHEKSLLKAKAYSWEGVVDEWLNLVGLPIPGK